jgi:hypothetical protein
MALYPNEIQVVTIEGLSADGDQIVVRGPKRAEALARELLARKVEVLAILDAAPGGGLGDGPSPTLERCLSCRERDFVRPRSGGTWCCARCQPLPSGIVAEWWPVVGESCDFGAVLR